MENIIKLIRDIFSMDFDVIVPVSGSIIAILVGFLLFAVRYFTFNHNRKKYEKRQKKSPSVTPEAKEDDEHKADLPEMEAAESHDKTPDDKGVGSL